jgi:hypothetical protein
MQPKQARTESIKAILRADTLQIEDINAFKCEICYNNEESF